MCPLRTPSRASPVVLHSLTADGLLQTMNTQYIQAACRMDIWRVAGLKSTSPPLLARMNDMLTYIKTHGSSPSSLESVRFSASSTKRKAVSHST